VVADSPGFERTSTKIDGDASPLGVPARFRVISEVGYGGMGVVYKARDLETDEIVALKLLKAEVSSDPRMREELRQEVCLARKVTHKNVCRIHELYRTATASCISMEFIGGETLLARLRRDGALPAADAIAIARQICAGLREAHAHGIVHRDLKPANIMIDGSGVAKIMDFGIARRAQENDHTTKTIAGTPEYMAPEQIELRAMGPQTDIYALGLLLYEMVTGTRAFTGDSAIAVAVKQLRESPRRPSEMVRSIPLGFEAVILKCLRKNAESRFQSVDELDAALCKSTGANASSMSIAPAAMKVDAAVKTASKHWQDLRPHLIRVSGDIHRGAQKLSLWAEIECKKLVLKTVSVTPPVLRKGPAARIAAVAAVAIVGIGSFAVIAANFSRRDAAVSQASVSQLEKGSDLQAAPIPAVTIPTVTTLAQSPAADIAIGSDSTGLDGSVSNPEDSADTSASSVPAEFSSVPDAHQPARKKPAAQNSALTAPKVNSVDAKNQIAVNRTLTHSPATVQDVKTVSEPSLASAPATLQPAAPPADPSRAGSKVDSSVPNYLEVGTFKDSKWADDAVDRLTQMGFHAICVHKTMLWKLQSYRVQVGPYATSSEMEAAQEQLTAQGFKPHAVK
jgi:cell division protein FtsN